MEATITAVRIIMTNITALQSPSCKDFKIVSDLRREWFIYAEIIAACDCFAAPGRPCSA
jgi:hypothetical protein